MKCQPSNIVAGEDLTKMLKASDRSSDDQDREGSMSAGGSNCQKDETTLDPRPVHRP